jgi:hypothetical protein
MFKHIFTSTRRRPAARVTRRPDPLPRIHYY